VSAAAAFILKSVSIIRGVRWRVGWTVTGPDLLEPLALVAACCRTADAAAKARLPNSLRHDLEFMENTSQLGLRDRMRWLPIAVDAHPF